MKDLKFVLQIILLVLGLMIMLLFVSVVVPTCVALTEIVYDLVKEWGSTL